MHNEPFVMRVQALRDSWAERRQVRGIAHIHDYPSQFRLLQAMHGWAEHAAEEIREVYGATMAAIVTACPEPPPNERQEERGFAVTVGPGFGAAFVLHDRRRLPGPSWSISVSVASSGSAGGGSAAGPERRNGQWTRTRLEDVLLSLLGAYERSLVGGDESLFAMPDAGLDLP
ncbi:MAG: hypothetical protein ACRDG3_04170 [Tepidiformaceae bacterium]